MMRDYKKIGQFTMTGEIMRVSDPCYDKHTCCSGPSGPSGLIFDCLPGNWDAAATYSDVILGTRVAMLIAKHESIPDFAICNQVRGDGERIYFSPQWRDSGIMVCVDSGQAGLFDDAKYQNNSVFDGMPEPVSTFGDIWYRHCCDLTLSEARAGVIPFGAVSSSGYGDGCYKVFKHENKFSKVDCVIIVFL